MDEVAKAKHDALCNGGCYDPPVNTDTLLNPYEGQPLWWFLFTGSLNGSDRGARSYVATFDDKERAISAGRTIAQRNGVWAHVAQLEPNDTLKIVWDYSEEQYEKRQAFSSAFHVQSDKASNVPTYPGGVKE